MRHLLFPTVLLCCLSSIVATEQPQKKRAVHAVVIELFHSEGCNSCPKVEQLVTQLQVKAIEQKVPIYCIAWHVDYWDRLGWKDPYADPAHTARQTAYIEKLRLPGKVTPSVIVNGHLPLAGFNHAGQLCSNELAQRPVALVGIKDVGLQDRRATIDVQLKGRLASLELHAVVVEGGLVSTPDAGELKGQTLKHECTVRAATFVATTLEEQQTVVLDLPADLVPGKARVIVFLQDPATLRIHAAHGKNLTRREGKEEKGEKSEVP